MTAVTAPIVQVDFSPDDPDPRRRRTGVCPCLRMDGDPVDYESLAAGGLRGPRFGNIGNAVLVARAHRFTCANRSPIHRVPGGYMADVCSSSWHKTCPFLVDP